MRVVKYKNYLGEYWIVECAATMVAISQAFNSEVMAMDYLKQLRNNKGNK